MPVTIEQARKELRRRANAELERRSGLRIDGTQKGEGFFGPLKLPNGGIATEFSIGVSFDGKETQIPSLVPTLTEQELNLMLNDIIPNQKEIPSSIIQKAVDHAKLRISEGKSPFKEADIFDQISDEPPSLDTIPRIDAPGVADPKDILPTGPTPPPKERPLQIEAHKGRFPLSPDATRLEKLDRAFDIAIGKPLRVFLKFAKGKTLNLPDLMWAGLKKITPDSIWDEEVKKMTLDEAMDWAAGHDPSGFEKAVGDVAEFIGRLQTAQKIGQATGILGTKQTLPKDIGILNKALESAKLFGLGESVNQFQKLLSEIIDPETDYQYEGAIAVIKDTGLGAGLSLGHSLIAKPLLARAAQTGAGKAIIESYDRAMIEITKRFPIFADAIRRNPSDTISKEVDRQFAARGIDPGQFNPEQRAVANHIAREMERRFVRASKNFRPAEDIVKAKVKPKLLPGKAGLPPEAPAVAAGPTPAVEKPVVPIKVAEKPEITAPAKAVKPEIQPKPLPTKEVTPKKEKAGPLTEVQSLAKELEKSLKLSPERALRVAKKKLALDAKKAVVNKIPEKAPKVTPPIEVTKKPEPRPPEQTTTEKTPVIQKQVTETVETDFTKATSAKQASLAEDRESMGLDEINSPDRRSWEESLRQATKEKIPSKANRIAEEVNANPRPLSDIETAGVVQRMAELKSEHQAAMDDIGETKDGVEVKTKAAEIERIEAEFDALTRAVQLSGTEKGRALAAQKLTINKDFKLISVLNRAKAAAGKKLTAIQNKIFKGLTEKLTKTTKRVETLEAQINELQAKSQLQRGNKRFRNMTLQQKNRNIQTLANRAKVLLEQGCAN